MAWSNETLNACLQYGIPGSPRLFFTEAYSFTGGLGVGKTPTTLIGMYGGQALWTCSSGIGYYASSYHDLVFTPDTIQDGVVAWYFDKAASTYDAYLNMVDNSNNVVYQVPVGFDYTTFEQEGLLDGEGGGIYNAFRPAYLMLGAAPNDPNWALSIGFYSEPSSFAVSYGDWPSYPQYVDNIGNNSLIYGNIPDYIDKLFNGNYGDPQSIAPSGGMAGGGGSWNRPDYAINIPSLPTISVCDTGMISLYEVSTGQLQTFGNYLWDNNFFNSIVKNFQSPMDNIVSLQMVPVSSARLKGTAGTIVLGNVDTLISCNKKLSTSYYEINCGTLSVKEFYKTFADYAPYVDIHLFLPYIGIVRVNPDDVMRGYIKVVYHVDVFSGSCVAFVSCNTNGVWHVIQQHSGNISAQFPVSGANFSSVYIGAINSISSLATGNVMGSINGAANIKPSYERSGGVTSVSGIMGVQIPYLIFSTPKYIVADNFQDVKGYTSNLTVNIGSQTGFLQATADNSELSGIGCTKQEEDMIRDLLSSGIYV